MDKISYLLLFLILTSGIAYSGQGKIKIVPCDGHYCTQLESGEEYKIVKQVDWALNKLTLSPDEKYVAYTTSNWLGFENEGRDVFYCKVDGSERTFLHKFDLFVDSLLWVTYKEKEFVFVIFEYCHLDYGGIQIIDIKSRNIILTLLGDSLSSVQGTKCYQLYCFDKPIQKERDIICLEDLLTIKDSDSLNLRFFAGWTSGDIYISNKRDPLIRFGDPTTSPNQDELSLRSLLRTGKYPVSKIIPNTDNNRIAFYGNRDTFGFFGVFDLENKKLLIFVLSESLKFSYPIWSPDGCRLAILRTSPFSRDFFFYEFEEYGKVSKIRTYMLNNLPVSGLRWSEDSRKFYFSYDKDNKKVEEQIDIPR